MKYYIDMELIKKLMAEQGLDVKTMAERMKLTPRTVKKYLDGADQSRLLTSLLFKFAKALHVDALTLLFDD